MQHVLHFFCLEIWWIKIFFVILRAKRKSLLTTTLKAFTTTFLLTLAPFKDYTI